MASYMTIGTALYQDEVRERLHSELRYLTGDQLALECQEKTASSWSFFALRMGDDQRGQRGFACRFAVSKAISEIFVDVVEINYVRRYIERTYHYWSAKDRSELLVCTLETLEKLKSVRRNRILQALYDYLADQDFLIVEGFARFRLNEHWSYLQRLVKRSGQELLEARDYLEFIRLLRCFIDMQEPKIAEVHIFITTEGTFYLCDETGNVIRREHLRTPSFTVSEGEFNYKDYLLSMLITLAPKVIIFHVSDQIWDCDPLQTIQQVFGPRIVRCSGCEKCRNLNVHKN